MQRAYLSSSTDAMVLEDCNDIFEHQHTFYAYDFASLDAATRPSAFKAAVRQFWKEFPSSSANSCFVVMTPTQIYSASRGKSQLYFVITDKNDDVITFYELCKSELNERMQVTSFELQKDDQAFVIHDYNNVLERLPLNTHEMRLGKGELAAEFITGPSPRPKNHTIAKSQSCDALSKKASEAKKQIKKPESYFMLAPIESDMTPKVFCFSGGPKISKFELFFTEKIKEQLPFAKQSAFMFAYSQPGLKMAHNETGLGVIRYLFKKNISLCHKLKAYHETIEQKLAKIKSIRNERNYTATDKLNDEVTALLFEFYLNVYMWRELATPEEDTVNSVRLINYLETSLIENYQFLATVAPHKALNAKTPANRILWHTGETYPKCISDVETSLKTVLEEKSLTNISKRTFVHMGKALVRLGPQGYVKSQGLFANSKTHVKSKHIKKYYEKNVESKPLPPSPKFSN